MSILTFDELAELDRNDELVDELVIAERVPGTQLVHLAVGQRSGLVLTRDQARALGADLIRVAGGRGRAGRGADRAAAERR